MILIVLKKIYTEKTATYQKKIHNKRHILNDEIYRQHVFYGTLTYFLFCENKIQYIFKCTKRIFHTILYLMNTILKINYINYQLVY